jgi:hypothetical protein
MYRTSENAKRWKERLQKMFEKGLRDAEALSRLEKEIDIIEDRLMTRRIIFLTKVYSQHKLMSPLEFIHLIELELSMI